jgi:hypothetical protein
MKSYNERTDVYLQPLQKQIEGIHPPYAKTFKRRYTEEIAPEDPVRASTENREYSEALAFNERKISFGEIFSVVFFLVLCSVMIYGMLSGKM